MACNDNIAQLSNQQFFGTEFFDTTLCTLPLISGCGNEAATYDPSNDYCYYPEPDCLAQNRTPIAVTCDTKSSDVARFCICTNMVVSAGNQLSAFFGMTLAMLFFFHPRFALLMLVFIGIASAHNWINSPSRSPYASTYSPFRPAITPLPTAQVGPNQTFQIEWMTAHYGETYFAVVHSKYESYMSGINQTLLDDYIALAPPSAFINATSGKWQRFARKDKPGLDNDHPGLIGDPIQTNYFQSIINSSNPLFISRPPSWPGRVGDVNNPTDNNTYLMQYKTSELALDVRVSYQSSKYPWLEAVHKFNHSADQNARPDTAVRL
jgi:hypothetical protein